MHMLSKNLCPLKNCSCQSQHQGDLFLIWTLVKGVSDLTGGSDSMSNEPDLKNRLRMNQSGRFLDGKFETGILTSRFIHPSLVSTSAV
jgi:hypothetical protein